jgi:hypothetical protein
MGVDCPLFADGIPVLACGTLHPSVVSPRDHLGGARFRPPRPPQSAYRAASLLFRDPPVTFPTFRPKPVLRRVLDD